MGLKFASGFVWYRAKIKSLKDTSISLGTFPGNIADPRGVGNRLHSEYDYVKVRCKLSHSEVAWKAHFFILLIPVWTISHEHPCPRSESKRTRDLKVNCAKAEQLSLVWVLPVVAVV